MKVREGRLGLVAAYQKAMNKLDSLTPLGYSLAGEGERTRDVGRPPETGATLDY
jgi:hypothetical protein